MSRPTRILPGDGFAREPAALAETFRYCESLAGWLGCRS